MGRRMTDTILSMWFPICVLIVAGLITLGTAWWCSVAAEGKDEWLTGADE